MKKIWYSIKDYVYIVLIVVLIRTFLITPAAVSGSSMESTLNNHDLVIINKLVYRIKPIERFDIVVVNNDEDNDRIIKRVIGLPNETIEYKDNKLYINAKLIETKLSFEYTDDFKVETKEDEYFVLGDNRDVSKDSRMLGNFNKKDIKRSFLPYVFLVLLLIGIYYMAVVGNQTVNKITYDKFLDELNNQGPGGIGSDTFDPFGSGNDDIFGIF